MIPLHLAASTLVNGCGAGWRDIADALLQDRSGLRRNDFEPAQELGTWIGRVDGVETVSLPDRYAGFDCRANRLILMALELDGFAHAVHALRTRVGAERIGVFLGTSTSGILETELRVRAAQRSGRAPQWPDGFYAQRHSMFAGARFVREYLALRGPALTVSTACSSSAKVFGAAARAIAIGLCDAAVVGGADSLALSTLYGFRALELLSRDPCRPCAIDRSGISIGEAAGFALCVPEPEAAVCVRGCGESADAWHMSSPHPEGAGAAAAMRAALDGAGLAPHDIDYVNLHGTATPANDMAEDRAVTAMLPHRPACSSTKGWTGHALGAAGITEALITAFALERQWLPGTLNCDTVDPALAMRVETRSRPACLRHAMSNSFGFGGNNCSLVMSVGHE
jgi:3-oxoacyl-[acyl-carrier-protein] synthase-1